MDPNEPTHFNVLIAGTGLHESILAAALSKAGYSVLQLDSAPYYGSEHASLSLLELADWAAANPEASTSSPTPPDSLHRISQRFALSLYPVLLRARGPGIDLLVRSKVSSYLQFGLLGGIALWQAPTTAEGQGATGPAQGKAVRVPASKADVFNDPTLSLVEKRRLTKLLLFAAGDDVLEQDPVLAADPHISFLDYLKRSYSLTGNIADSLAYALALCSSPADGALPALRRLRAMIQSMGRYGPSPYLVGHYGGAGDLVGGFSRICAVWGGGQILGRQILALDPSPAVGLPVPASQPPFAVHEHPPPPPASTFATDGSDSSEMRPLGIPVVLEEGQAPTLFTGDWVVSSPNLLSHLFPQSPSSATAEPASSRRGRTAHLIAVLSSPISFPPPPRQSRAEHEGASGTDLDAAAAADDDEPDSKLLVFSPGALDSRLGTCTALMVGAGTMSCPEGYYVLYLAAPIISDEAGQDAPSTTTTTTARTLLTPYLDALLSLKDPTRAVPSGPDRSADAEASAGGSGGGAGEEVPRPTPLYSVAYLSPPPSFSPESSARPANLLVTSLEAGIPVSSEQSSSSHAADATTMEGTAPWVDTLDRLPTAVEASFWTIVGPEGRAEGVQFFAPATATAEEGEGEGDDDPHGENE